MPRLGPIKRRDLIAYLLKCGFDKPEPGGKHQLMRRDDLTIQIPNPHQGDISVGLLNRILKQAEISKAEWEKL